jgi:eukaryotic-like serine/threonine-protein kinase
VSMTTSSDDRDRTTDQASPFDSTDRALAPSPSDPPTSLVRASGFVELPPGSVVDETYEIDARLGEGAMGEVYAARHLKLGKRVAIKVIGRRLSEDGAAIERFAMEARTLAQIQHPAIVAVEHIGELTDGRAYFVMELLRGETLFDRLARGRVYLNEALRILDQMARGLEAAHSQGVIHRDLKPENTFLVNLPGEDLPAVKLLDYGLMKLAAERSDADRRAERTQSGVAIGTPMYMSPEQMRGPDVDHRTDIYALGCVAYELVLGVAPFPRALTAPELYAAHLHEAPPLPRVIWPEIPPQLDLCLFAMLAKDPDHRPTLAQVRAVIAAVREDESPQRAKTEYVGRAPRAGRRLAIIATAVVALVGGVTIGTILTATPSDTEKADKDASTPLPHEAKIPAPVVVPAAPAASAVPATPAPTESPKTEHPSPTRPTRRVEPPRQPPRIGSATATVPVDTGGTDPVVEIPKPLTTPPPAAPIDRNQTVNPFAKKHKVTP